MTKFLVAKNIGFCSGVRRAVDTAMSVNAQNTYLLGEIIHNEQVNADIKARGIITVDAVESVPSGARLLIRSHGVGKQVYDYCEQNGIETVDCTCTFVKKIQRIVESKYKEGYQIIIIGSKNHPEVIGLNGWCNFTAVIADENTDFESLNLPDKLCVVCQSTSNCEIFDKIIKNIKKLCDKIVEIFKTICYTTNVRQSEAASLAKQCDAMLVLGSSGSSNTKKLYDVCLQHCQNVFWINSSNISGINDILKYKIVGIVSGASTSNRQTQEVLLKMDDNTEVKTTEEVSDMQSVVEKMDNGENKLKKGQVVSVIISAADDNGISVLLPFAKKEVFLDKEDIDVAEYAKADFVSKVGESIDVIVINVTPQVKLSQKAIARLKEEEGVINGIENGEEFSITCTASNKGGLTGTFGTYSVFVPAKEIRTGYVKDLEKFVGKKLRLKALEIKRGERKKEIIASQRVILAAEYAEKEQARAEKEAEFFGSISVGDEVEGKVERVTDFGAFVNVKGFDCLAHISDLSWSNIKNVNEVLTIGKTYTFKVLKVDTESKKVSIGYKQLQPQPWELISNQYAEGDVVVGKVVRIVPFGAFISVADGVDGLVHVSQISHEWLENPTSVLTIGEEVEAKIIALDCANKKMTLSIKALTPEPEVKKVRPKAEGDEASSEEKPARAARKPRGERTDRRERKEDPDEVREWNESSVSGASIAEMLEISKKK